MARIRWVASGVVIAAALVMNTAALAADPPPLPMSVYGQVRTTAGAAVTQGAVQAFLNGAANGSIAIAADGTFGGLGLAPQLVVSGTAADAGAPVTFKVNGQAATPSPAVTWQSGTRVGDLTLTAPDPTTVQQGIAHTLVNVVEDGVTRSKVWITLRAEGALLNGQATTLPSGIRHVEAVATYNPGCLTVLAATASSPFTTTASAINAGMGRITLTADLPQAAADVPLPLEFGRVLARLTGPTTANCVFTLDGATVYQPGSGTGFAVWSAAASVSKTYRRGDVLGNGNPKSVAQAIGVLQFLVGLRTIAQINPVNAASIRAAQPSSGPDQGDHISTAHAILILRLVVGIVDDSYQASRVSNIANFTLESFTIPKGTTVVWTNQDSAPHTATSSATPRVWDTGFLNQGQSSVGVTFNTAGTFPYFCQVHPSMQATLTVTA